MKARSPEKFMDVSDVKVTDEDGFLSCSMMIKAKNIIMKERIWINRVAQRDVTNVKCSGEWFNMESRNLVLGDLMKLTLGQSTHIETRDVGGRSVSRSMEWCSAR